MRSDLKLHHQVHHGSRSRVWLATRVPTGEPVIVKEHLASPSASVAAARTQHEFRMGSAIDSAHVVHYLGLEQDRNRVALLEEAAGDKTLAELAARGLDVELALRLCVQVSRGLDDIHIHQIIHRAIHPSNVVVDERTWVAKIVDFSAASFARKGTTTEPELDQLGMPLAYASPEQIGRTNREVDYRSDLYSLGATLYELFAGHPPFETDDPLALAHAHMALLPTPLWEAAPRVPKQISRIVERLLAKSPDERYQSARGVAEDLDECLRQLRGVGSVSTFTLGSSDRLQRFEIPAKLYGRSRERAQLLDAFGEAAAGHRLVLTVAGYSGIGKSSLVNELAKKVVERGGTFVAGKFDQLHRHAPYSALSQALNQACRQLLGLPEAELQVWRQRIVEHLAGNAGLIADLAPDLERVIGRQPPVPAAGPLEGPQRFSLTLARFFELFACEGAPLVLFLDDLQWGDPATFEALSMLLRLEEPAHFLMIGSYRDNEVNPEHPLSVALENLRGSGVELRALQLGGLQHEDVKLLLQDTLHRADAEVDELACLILEKTSGNPFFVDEFLRTLHAERLLRFLPQEQRWSWDLEEIRALQITENVVDLMVRNLERQPRATQDALRLGASLGSRFDLGLIADAAGVSSSEMLRRLAPAIRERLILPVGRQTVAGSAPSAAGGRGASESASELDDYDYRFLHDRVQKAVYESIPQAARPSLHLALGRCLRRERRDQTRGSWTFDVLDQLNRATSLIASPEERRELARLNLEAGKRARGTTAYREGLRYFTFGIAALQGEGWRDHYKLCAALQLGAVECAYLAGRFEEADARSTEVLPKLSTPGEKGELYALRIRIETSRGRYERALALAREGLALLGHPVPSMRSLLPLLALRLRLRWTMAGRKIEDLAREKEASDPGLLAPRKILNALMAAGLFVGPHLFFWAAHKQILWAVEQGVSPETADGCAHYGMLLVSHDRDYAQARQYGELSLKLCERFHAAGFSCRLYLLVGGFLKPHSRYHVRSSLPYLDRAVHAGMASGDLLYACYALTTSPMLSSMAGDSIDHVLQRIDRAERSTAAFRYDELNLVVRTMRQCMLLIQGKTESTTSLSSAGVSESTLADAAHQNPGFERLLRMEDHGPRLGGGDCRGGPPDSRRRSRGGGGATSPRDPGLTRVLRGLRDGRGTG
ncbi:MAG: serine/threonine-protein kinase PknK [Myxococcales bacterium]